MTQIPPEAMPVVEILRRDVKRPRRLPQKHDTICGGRWATVLRWNESFPKFYCCPMGLHPESQSSSPDDCSTFIERLEEMPLMHKAVQAFGKWWDSIAYPDRKAAVDAVWPRKKRGGK
jgi:hypothetical protein